MESEHSHSIITQASNLLGAVVQWAKDDFERVPKEVFEHRHEICKKCDNWDKNGFAGLGKCKVCGCSVAKLYLPHSICPLPVPLWIEHLTTPSASFDTSNR